MKRYRYYETLSADIGKNDIARRYADGKEPFDMWFSPGVVRHYDKDGEFIGTEEMPAPETFDDPQTTPVNHSESNTKKGDRTMKKFEFTADTLTCYNARLDAVKSFPARYALQDAADMKRGQMLPVVYIFATVDEKTVKIAVPSDDDFYAAAYHAAEQATQQAEQPADDPAPIQAEEQPEETPADHSADEQPAPIQAEEQPEEQPAADPVEELRKYDPEKAEKYARIIENIDAANATQQAEQPADDPAPIQAEEQPEETPADHSADEQPATPDHKQAHGPIPEKTFIGTSIKGARYEIIFDGDTQRTRVIIPAEHRDALKPIVEKAGFYYAAAMDSWNKKLTFRAYRAAVALAAALDKAA